MRDHACHYYLDTALVAFERNENRDQGLINIRDVFPKMQSKILWTVWWWANSEDKAKAKMERWREAQPIANPPRRL
jgi:hypothetical protein